MNVPINDKAPVKWRQQMEISAPVEIVWKVLTDIADWPKWQKAVTQTTIESEPNAGTGFKWKAAGLNFTSAIHTSTPYSEFGWTGSTLGTRAVHNWKFEQTTNGTRVSVEECMQGLLPALFRGFFQKTLVAGMNTSLLELKQAAETNKA